MQTKEKIKKGGINFLTQGYTFYIKPQYFAHTPFPQRFYFIDRCTRRANVISISFFSFLFFFHFFAFITVAFRMLEICFLLLSLCSVAQGVIPSYLPASRTSQNGRDKIITDYFYLGLSYGEMVSFLLLYHGIHISLRHLKRILRQMGLKRRKNHSHANDIVNAIEIELTRVGRICGYRQMHKILRDDYKLVVDRETVRLVLQHLDPEGVLCRKKNRLQRRVYTSKGPNYIWHIDGYDKLKPYGFCIHGCIDGYSRRIMWLEVSSTNNDPAIIGKYYTAAARQIKGVPRIIRSDLGTENDTVAGLQRYFRADATDDFAGFRSFLYGKSVSNQRIEAWWSFFKKSHTSWWINYFKDLRDSGVVDLTDELQKYGPTGIHLFKKKAAIVIPRQKGTMDLVCNSVLLHCYKKNCTRWHDTGILTESDTLIIMNAHLGSLMFSTSYRNLKKQLTTRHQ